MSFGIITSMKSDDLPKYTRSDLSPKENKIDYLISNSTDVWYGSSVWKHSIGIPGAMTHKKCTLEIENGALTLKKGNITIFQSPINHVVVQSLSNNGGGLQLVIGNKTYVILFYRPLFAAVTDITTQKASSWVQLLQTAGATVK